jgi:hypothetical protein
MKLWLSAVLAVLSASAFGDDRFLVIRHGPAALVDATPQLLVNFTLPANVNRTNTISNYAVLDLVVRQSEFDFNEVYINPPFAICTDNNPDPNQAASVGLLDEHDDVNLKGENTTNHFTLNPSLLRAGNNVLMVCIRSLTGAVGQAAGNLDDINVRSVVLYYHTTP